MHNSFIELRDSLEDKIKATEGWVKIVEDLNTVDEACEAKLMRNCGPCKIPSECWMPG